MSYQPLPPHLDPRGRHRGGGHPPRAAVARPLGRVLGSLLSIALLIVAGYYWYTYREINNKVPRVQVNVGQAPTAAGTKGDIDGKDQNILLVGNDDRSTMTPSEVKALHAGESSGSLATDTMIIIHVPANGSKATLISVPRDSYVDIKGYGMGKINGAYADAYTNQASGATLDQRRTAGANLLVATLQNLTGLTINHYVQIDLLGFYRISNAIGGVRVNLCNNVNDSVAANRNANPPLSGGSGLVLSKGVHVIKGVQALEFVRQRHFLPRGDLDRVRRQQYFLTAAFRQVASVGILTKLRSLGDAVEKSVYLDPSLNLTDLGSQLQNLSANNIVSRTIPTTNGYVDGQDVEQVNVKKVQAFIDNLINPPAPVPSSSATPPTTGSSSTAGSSAPSSAASSTPPAIDTRCIN